MFKVYQGALLGKMDPKHFPSKFTDFWTEARTETNMSEAQMASNFKAWITQADGANKDKNDRGPRRFPNGLRPHRA